MRFYPEILELVGAALIVAGLALWAVPVALIIAGLFLVIAANTAPKPWAVPQVPAGTGRRPHRAA